ncbi:MAG: glycosyl transferase [Spirochaetales bacterium]|nr:MAG: glycosyl transferase [Spirochaetales bacterium]
MLTCPMQEEPTVSVIIPVYNRESLLKRALDSVRGQSFRGFDIHVINDGSTDGTGELIHQYIKNHPEISIFCHTTGNRGVSAARNLGIQQSTGRYIALLDSDDEWEPRKLSRQLEYLKHNPECRLVHTGETWIRGRQKVNAPAKYRKYGGEVFLQCLPLCMIGPSTVLADRSVFEQFGLFNEEYPVCEDYDLWLRISSRMEVGLVTEDTPPARPARRSCKKGNSPESRCFSSRMPETRPDRAL